MIPEQTEWTPEKKQELLDKYPTTCNKELSKYFNATIGAIKNQAGQLNVHKCPVFMKAQRAAVLAKRVVPLRKPCKPKPEKEKREYPKPPPIQNSRDKKRAREKASVMVAGTFIKPDKTMTFDRITEGKVAVTVQVNGKPIVVWCKPGKEEMTRQKWAAHVVQPPFSHNRAGGNIR